MIEQPVDLTYLANLIESKKPKCLCGRALSGANLRFYDHDGGYRTLNSYHEEMKEKQWIYVHCKKCGYDMALHKIARELE